MLDGAEQPVGSGQPVRLLGGNAAGRRECRQGVERRRSAQAGLASAVDQLVDLSEELDLADSAAAALQLEAGPERLPLGEMVADSPGDRLDLADRSEIEASAPDERMDGVEEITSDGGIAGGVAGADE